MIAAIVGSLLVGLIVGVAVGGMVGYTFGYDAAMGTWGRVNDRAMENDNERRES